MLRHGVPITNQTVAPLLDAAGVCAGTQVLDVASGPGYVAVAAHRRGAIVIGVDVAEALVALAQELHPELTFRQSEAEQLPFGAASFEAVVGNFLVNHLAVPEAAVAETRRVLKPGGRAAFTVWTSLIGQASLAFCSVQSRLSVFHRRSVCQRVRRSSASPTTRSSAAC